MLRCPSCSETLDHVCVEGHDLSPLVAALSFRADLTPSGTIEKVGLDESFCGPEQEAFFISLGHNEMWLDAVTFYVEKGENVVCPHCLDYFDLDPVRTSTVSAPKPTAQRLQLEEVKWYTLSGDKMIAANGVRLDGQDDKASSSFTDDDALWM